MNRDFNTHIAYANKLRAIRPYVDFNYDLRHELHSSQKAKINKYFGEISKLQLRETQIYRSRDKKRLRVVQQFAQHDIKKYPAITVAFIPNNGQKMRIRFNAHGEVVGEIYGGKIRQINIVLDPVRLINEGEEYLDHVIDNAPKMDQYVPQAGEFETHQSLARPFITSAVLRLMNKYDSTHFDVKDKNSHHFANWLHGITGYKAKAVTDISRYRADKQRKTLVNSRREVNERRRVKSSDPGFWVNHKNKSAKRATPPQPREWVQVKPREYYRLVFEENYREKK